VAAGGGGAGVAATVGGGGGDVGAAAGVPVCAGGVGGVQYARARDAAVGGREGDICGRPGVCAVWAVGGCGGVAFVRGAMGCCQGWRVLISSLRGRRCGHLATGRVTVARPRLVCPHERSDPAVLPVWVRSRRVSDRPASAFGHTPPHERYVTHFTDPGSEAEMARGRPVPRGTIFYPWVAVETKLS